MEISNFEKVNILNFVKNATTLLMIHFLLPKVLIHKHIVSHNTYKMTVICSDNFVPEQELPNVINHFQSGFSTSRMATTLTKIANDIRMGMEKQQLTVLIL